MGEKHLVMLSVGFHTSRELAADELDALISAVCAQVEEPPSGSVEVRRADYTTENVTVRHESTTYSA